MSSQIQNLSEDILEENIDYAEEELKKVYRDKRQSMNKVLKFMAGVYATNLVVDGILQPSKADKRKLQMDFNNLLTSVAVNMGKTEEKVIADILKFATAEAFYKTQFVIQTGFARDLTFSRLSAKQIEEIVNSNFKYKTFSQRIWDNQNLLINKLNKELNSAMREGKSIDKITRAIRDQFATSTYNARRLCVTELARCQSEASDMVYKDSEVVNQVMFTATLDEKTSEICEQMDGQKFSANEDYPKPPLHPNCRSVIIPVIEGWEPSRRKENIKTDGTKQVINYTSYKNWKDSRGL